MKLDDPYRKTVHWQRENLYPALKQLLEIFFECNYFYSPEVANASKLLYGHIVSGMMEG